MEHAVVAKVRNEQVHGPLSCARCLRRYSVGSLDSLVRSGSLRSAFPSNAGSGSAVRGHCERVPARTSPFVSGALALSSCPFIVVAVVLVCGRVVARDPSLLIARLVAGFSGPWNIPRVTT